MPAATSPSSFDAFYVRYVPFVRRILAQRGVTEPDLDDVTQETFVTVHRLLPGFEGRSSIETWLHSVAWRVAANHRRRKRMRGSWFGPVAPNAESEPSLVADRYVASFDLIDDDNRDLLALHEIGGLSISSLAELTGKARATIRRRLESGRAAIERALSRRGPRPERVARLERVAARFDDSREIVPAPVMRVLPDGQTCISTIDDLVLSVWRGPSTDESVQMLVETVIAHARTRPTGIRYFALIESTSSAPTREGRDMIRWIAGKLGKTLRAIAITAEGPLMPLVANIMNATLFLSRAAPDTRYFSDLPPALAWLAQYGPTDLAQTSDHLETIRQRLDPPKRR